MNDVSKKSPSRILAAGGAGFLVLAGYFLVRDLALPPEILLTAGALVASLAAVLRWPRRWPAVTPGVLLGLALAGGGWYAAVTSPVLLPALVVTAVGSIAAVALHGREGGGPAPSVAGSLSWYAAGTSFVAATAALSFHFLTAGVGEESIAPRLIPTVAWLAAGLAILIAARSRSTPPGQVGLALAGIAVVKALVYDSIRLQGPLRVTLFAAVGALLLAGARLAAGPGGREAR